MDPIENVRPSSSVSYRLVLEEGHILQNCRKVDESNEETNLFLLIANNLNTDTQINAGYGSTWAVNSVVLVSNAKFAEVYDSKNVYVNTFKGVNYDGGENTLAEAPCPLYTIDMEFSPPLVIASAMDHVLKIKPLSLKTKGVGAAAKPTSKAFGIALMSIRVSSIAMSGESDLSNTMRPEDIFDLSQAMSAMSGLFTSNNQAQAADGVNIPAGGGGMHSDLLRSLLPSILSRQAPQNMSAVPATGVSPSAAAPSVDSSPAAPDTASTAAVLSTPASMDQVMHMVESGVDARTATLSARIEQLEGQVASLTTTLEAMRSADVGKENFVVVDQDASL